MPPGIESLYWAEIKNNSKHAEMLSQGDQSAWAVQLELPEPAAARHPQTLATLREQASWLDQLATGTPRRAALAVQRQLSFLVRDPNPPAAYSQLLQGFHGVVSNLQEQGSAILTLPTGLRSPQHRALLEVLPGMLEDLTLAHIRAARLALAHQHRPPETDVFAATITLLRLLEWSLLQYQQIRPNLWRQMIQLHRVMERFGVGTKPQEIELLTAADPVTGKAALLAALLLLLADTYRYPLADTRSLIQALPELAPELRLHRASTGRPEIPLLLHSDVSPLDFARRPHGQAPSHYLRIDRLLARLRELGRADPEQETAQLLERDLLALLKGKRERCYPREIRNANYRCVHGLEAVHERLLQLQLSEGMASIPGPGEVTESEQHRISCRQNDISVGGASFILSADTPTPTPGAWLLFESTQQERSGFVARLRRRLVDDNQYQYIGVERLPGHVIPVTAGTLRLPALLHAQPRHQRFRLIAPRGHYRGKGGAETLTGTHRDYRVRHEKCASRQKDSEIIELCLLK